MTRPSLLALMGLLALAAPVAAAPKAAHKAAPLASAEASPPQAGRPAPKTRPVGDKAILRTEADAMGFIRGLGAGETTNTINRVQIRGAGKVAVGGTTINVAHYIYTLSLHLKAAREDIQPAQGARVVRVVLDKEAWDETAPGEGGRATGDSALSRRLQLARTPFGFTRALLDAAPGTVKVADPGPGGKVTIALPIEGVPTTATLDADYRPETIAMTVDGKAIVTRYGAYRDLSEYGLMFPTRWTETVDGKASLDLKIDDGRVASYAVFPKPAALAAR